MFHAGTDERVRGSPAPSTFGLGDFDQTTAPGWALWLSVLGPARTRAGIRGAGREQNCLQKLHLLSKRRNVTEEGLPRDEILVPVISLMRHLAAPSAAFRCYVSMGRRSSLVEGRRLGFQLLLRQTLTYCIVSPEGGRERRLMFICMQAPFQISLPARPPPTARVCSFLVLARMSISENTERESKRFPPRYRSQGPEPPGPGVWLRSLRNGRSVSSLLLF